MMATISPVAIPQVAKLSMRRFFCSPVQLAGEPGFTQAEVDTLLSSYTRTGDVKRMYVEKAKVRTSFKPFTIRIRNGIRY